MKLVIVLALLSSILIVYHLTHKEEVEPEDDKHDLKVGFANFMSEFGRQYKDTEEFEFRFSVYKKNVELIESQRKSGVTHSLAINDFGDWTDAEFEKLLGLRGRPKPIRSEKEPIQNDNDPIPEATFFWSKLGNGKGVHPIKNQGSCGSCWAFAAIAAYENAYWQWTGEGDMLDFSEQQLVDCSFSFYNDGCRGGELSYAYQYLERYKATVLQNYPYQAKDQACKYYTTYYRPGPKLFKYSEQNNTNVNSLKQMIHNNVVSVAVEAKNWKFYAGGLYDETQCGEDIDHGVAVVGYDSTNNYWLIKNSWGERWGEAGFMKLPITTTKKEFKDGVCGILNRPSFPWLSGE